MYQPSGRHERRRHRTTMQVELIIAFRSFSMCSNLRADRPVDELEQNCILYSSTMSSYWSIVGCSLSSLSSLVASVIKSCRTIRLPFQLTDPAWCQLRLRAIGKNELVQLRSSSHSSISHTTHSIVGSFHVKSTQKMTTPLDFPPIW